MDTSMEAVVVMEEEVVDTELVNVRGGGSAVEVAVDTAMETEDGGGVVEVVVAVDTAMEAMVVMEKEVVDTEVEDVRDRYSGGGSSYS